MNIPGYDQNPMPEAQADGDPGPQDQMQGDGLHHHQIDQDEGGGFHSLHTFPDGRQEPADHADYEEAKAKQDSDFGCGDDMEGGEEDDSLGGSDMDDDSGPENIAASYGSKARQ